MVYPSLEIEVMSFSLEVLGLHFVTHYHSIKYAQLYEYSVLMQFI